ncbi:MAG: hypothetical protein HZA79_14150 [Sphingobacteriales bacterium]|nr:hypothetical protein [Sphingobacteriales bacterium]
MKKAEKGFILGLFILSIFVKSNFIYGQVEFEKQYALIKSDIKAPFETLRKSARLGYRDSCCTDTFLIDHIIHKYSNSRNLWSHISNRNYLQKFSSLVLRTGVAKLSFEGKDTLEINISVVEKGIEYLGDIEYDSTNLPGIRAMEYDFRYVKTIGGRPVYGFIYDTNKVTQIAEFSVTINQEKHTVDKSLLSDLFFPNLCEKYYAKNPVEAFLSPDEKYIYLYLFGGQEANTYLCKFIIDIELNAVVGRMLASFKELDFYQFNYIGFIGF